MTDDPDDIADFLSLLPQNILEENGKIAIAFTFMEDELNGFMADLLGADGMTASDPMYGPAVRCKRTLSSWG